MKLDNLNFIDKSLEVKFLGYDNDIELPDKKMELKNKAKQMKQTKFINLSMAQEPGDSEY